MARSRNIKPSFFLNDTLAEIDPLGRILFIGMWTICDFKGDFEWREKRIKVQILPYDNCDIKELAINLDKSGLIRFSSDGEKVYANIPNFSKHQNPHKNERDKGSDIPTFSESGRQFIDLNTLTINRDSNGLNLDDSQSDRADSLLLIPDSLSQIRKTKFAEWWNCYGKKVDRKKSESAWLNLKWKKLGIEPDDLIADTKARHNHDRKWPEYQPNPLTYLHGEKWNDEIQERKKVVPSSMGEIRQLVSAENILLPDGCELYEARKIISQQTGMSL